ncbi:hypothetical protein BXZ70DRAFT_1008648 [Cristinia sonorae]|uniref:Major facilitator superfamily (MFS) profile domain-containing protein n=1 Tax=Cristinia sonorae TaxID=1940300 RepID=A0A8K0UMU4_9AGAR|nr:hypothetical protein BXZ70DRAFT_1008648 [Cristinia sonorae]
MTMMLVLAELRWWTGLHHCSYPGLDRHIIKYYITGHAEAISIIGVLVVWLRGIMGISLVPGRSILFRVLGFGYDKLTATPAAIKGFTFLYCLTNFFQNFGPNTTTFIVPGEAFPTRYRSTSHGISAASGKLGAVVAQVGFSQLVNIGGPNKFVKHLSEIFAFFMLTGIFSTLLIVASGIPGRLILKKRVAQTREQYRLSEEK